MFVRVVRFTDVTSERVQELVSRIEESDGPPPGVPSAGIQLLFDEDQGTALAIMSFDSAEDMKKGDQAFRDMDASQTPGTRVSIDMCELKIARQA